MRDRSDGKTRKKGKNLLDDLTGMKECWNLKEETPDRSEWRTRFGRGYKPVVRQTVE